MTSLTFHDGISTIGGNCIILEEKGTRIMLDNGICFPKKVTIIKIF